MRYFEIEDTKRVFIHQGATNMSKSFNGLSLMAKEELRKSPTSGDLFLFFNSKRNYAKVLCYSRGGYCLFAKRLDTGTFPILNRKSIDAETLQELLNEETEVSYTSVSEQIEARL